MEQGLRAVSPAALLSPRGLVERVGGSPVYVLVDPAQEGPEVSVLDEGDKGLLWLYTSVALLVQACGGGQPYVSLTAPDVVELADGVDGVLLVALDVWHPAGARFPDPEPREFEPIEPVPTGSADESLVWFPTLPVRAGDLQVTAELYGRRAGERLLLIFDSPQEAWRACGAFQPLSAVRLEDLDAVVAECGADGVVAGNGVLADQARHSAPVFTWQREGRKTPQTLTLFNEED